MGIVFYQNSVIGELFWHSRINGYDFSETLQIYGYSFEKFLRIYGYTFEKVFRIYWWYFYDLNGTTPYLGNSSYPPPPGNPPPRAREAEIKQNFEGLERVVHILALNYSRINYSTPSNTDTLSHGNNFGN